jgi:hypothetical protein
MSGPIVPRYVEAATVLQEVAASLSRSVDSLAAAADVRWEPICTRNANAANAYVHRLLTGQKGYTPAQVAADQTVPPLVLQLAVARSLLDGGQTNEYSLEAIKLMLEQVKEELSAFPVMTPAEAVPPGGESLGGAVGSGVMDAANTFNPPWDG